MLRHPPDILVTTPESLFLVLTSRARAFLEPVDTVIVDEIHALVGTKRGAHLALTLERLEEVARRPLQRIGLSATQRPLEEVARFLGGGEGLRAWKPRPVTIVDAGAKKAFDLRVEVPVEDMARLGEAIEPSADEIPEGPASVPRRRSIWPAIHPRLLELVRAHRSTILFVNSRRLAERLAAALNELAGEEIARAHHGSIAREERLLIEDALKAGRLPALVATSSLELGIDMGAVDLVIQIETPDLGRERDAADRPGEPPGGGGLARHHLPEVPRRPPRERRDHEGDEGGRGRGDARPPEPARRPRPAARGDGRARRAEGGRALRPLAPRRALLGPRPDAVRGRPRHALGPLPVGRLRGAAAARRVGPPPGRRETPRGHAAARRPERRDHPRPGPLRRLPGRRRGRRQASRRARRGDGLREPRRRGLRPRRHQLADRRDHARPRARGARARRAGEDALLEGRPGRAAGGDGPRDRPPDPGAPRDDAGGGGRAAAARPRPRPPGRAEPPRLPRGPARGDRGPARRPHDRPGAHARRDGRLAPVPPVALGRAHPRALGDRPGGALAAVGRGRGRVDLERRRHRPPPAGARASPGGRGPPPGAGGDRGPRGRRAGGDEPLRRPLPGGSRPRAPPAAPPAGPPDAAVDAEEAGPRPPPGRGAVPVLPDRPRGLPRVPARRVRPAGARGDRLPRAAARDPPGHGGHAVALALLGVSPLRLRGQLPLRGRRARSPSGARRPWPSTRRSCAISSARRSCASSSTAGPSASWRSRCSAWTPPTRPRAPSASTTCCCASATSRRTRRRRACARSRTATPWLPRRPGSACSSASGAPSGSASRARSAGPPPRTRGACATRSASRCRRAFPARSSIVRLTPSAM